jgi:Carbohydrate-selective porin, OprB family
MLEAVKSLPRIILALLAGLGFGLHARANVVQSARHSDGYSISYSAWACLDSIGGAPAVHNLVNFYADGGFNLLAPLPGRNDDTLGVGVGFTKVSEHGSRVS